MQNKELLSQGEKVDVESLELGFVGALPNKIQRKHGKFILLLINRAPRPIDSFTLDLADTGAPPAAPLARLYGLNRRQIAIAVDAPPGVFYLRSATGKVVCTLTFE